MASGAIRTRARARQAAKVWWSVSAARSHTGIVGKSAPCSGDSALGCLASRDGTFRRCRPRAFFIRRHHRRPFLIPSWVSSVPRPQVRNPCVWILLRHPPSPLPGVRASGNPACLGARAVWLSFQAPHSATFRTVVPSIAFRAHLRFRFAVGSLWVRFGFLWVRFGAAFRATGV